MGQIHTRAHTHLGIHTHTERNRHGHTETLLTPTGADAHNRTLTHKDRQADTHRHTETHVPLPKSCGRRGQPDREMLTPQKSGAHPDSCHTEGLEQAGGSGGQPPSPAAGQPRTPYFPGGGKVGAGGLRVGTGSNIKETESILAANLEENQWSLMRFDFSPR